MTPYRGGPPDPRELREIALEARQFVRARLRRRVQALVIVSVSVVGLSAALRAVAAHSAVPAYAVPIDFTHCRGEEPMPPSATFMHFEGFDEAVARPAPARACAPSRIRLP